MIYLQNTTTNEIAEFINEDSIGLNYAVGWQPATEQQITAYFLDKAKTSKLAEIKAKRDQALNKNITFDNKEYKGTENARSLFCTRFNLGVFPIQWRFADDINWISLNKEKATGLANAFLDDSSSMYQKETNFLIALNQATTIENINNIIINY